DLKVDQKDKSITFSLKDRLEMVAVGDAITAAGMNCAVEIDGKKERWGIQRMFREVHSTVGGGEVVGEIPGVHACCEACQQECRKAIEGAHKESKVEFQGDGPLKTVKITCKGQQVDVTSIREALEKAGFKGQSMP